MQDGILCKLSDVGEIIMQGSDQMKGRGHKPSRLTQQQIIRAMMVCAGILACVFIWSAVGAAVNRTPGIAIAEAVSDVWFRRSAAISLASGKEPESTVKQTLTAENGSAKQDAVAGESTENETLEETSEATEDTAEVSLDSREADMQEKNIYSVINDATLNNPESNMVDVLSLGEADGDTVRAWINEYTIGDFKYLGGEPMTDAARAAVEERRNLDALPDIVKPQFGIVAENAAVRSYPTWLSLSKGLGEHDFDYFQESMFLVGEPVAIYHSTQDGAWSFVCGTNYRGWVETGKIALCDASELKAWLDSENYVVTDAYLTVGDVTLRMGTVLFGEKQQNGDVDLTLPERKDDGTLTKKIATVSGGDGINEGYLKLSTDLILKQARLLLGTPYGWGDSNGYMDCSSTMNSIYRCFGIILPRNTSSLMATGTEVNSLSGMTAEEKLEYIKTKEPGTILLMDGHVVMYIGEVDGIQSILHNFVGYSTDGGKTKVDTYVCSITPIDITTTSGTNYLDRYEYTISFSQWYK